MIVTASPGKVDRVRALGADHVINYQAEDFAQAIGVLTDKHGADVILDHLGGAYLKGNLKALALGGRLVIIGLMGGARSEINLAPVMVKRQQIIGSVLRSRPVDEKSGDHPGVQGKSAAALRGSAHRAPHPRGVAAGRSGRRPQHDGIQRPLREDRTGGNLRQDFMLAILAMRTGWMCGLRQTGS